MDCIQFLPNHVSFTLIFSSNQKSKKEKKKNEIVKGKSAQQNKSIFFTSFSFRSNASRQNIVKCTFSPIDLDIFRSSISAFDCGIKVIKVDGNSCAFHGIELQTSKWLLFRCFFPVFLSYHSNKSSNFAQNKLSNIKFLFCWQRTQCGQWSKMAFGRTNKFHRLVNSVKKQSESREPKNKWKRFCFSSFRFLNNSRRLQCHGESRTCEHFAANKPLHYGSTLNFRITSIVHIEKFLAQTKIHFTTNALHFDCLAIYTLSFLLYLSTMCAAKNTHALPHMMSYMRRKFIDNFFLANCHEK